MWPICVPRWQVLEQRCARCAPANSHRSRTTSLVGAGDRGDAVVGYRSAAERFAKTRRLAALRAVGLSIAECALAAGRPSITVGGKRLWRNRNHLDTTDMSEQQWRDRWDAARLFLTADGESGKAGGNETIRVDAAGQLRIKVPAALVERVRLASGDR